MNKYEIMFIVLSTLEEEKRTAAVNMVKEIIETEGTIQKEDVWGMRKLAYPILKKNEGYYVVLEFTAPPDFPLELDRRLKISDSIIRHIIINKNEK